MAGNSLFPKCPPKTEDLCLGFVNISPTDIATNRFQCSTTLKEMERLKIQPISLALTWSRSASEVDISIFSLFCSQMFSEFLLLNLERYSYRSPTSKLPGVGQHPMKNLVHLQKSTLPVKENDFKSSFHKRISIFTGIIRAETIFLFYRFPLPESRLVYLRVKNLRLVNKC